MKKCDLPLVILSVLGITILISSDSSFDLFNPINKFSVSYIFGQESNDVLHLDKFFKEQENFLNELSKKEDTDNSVTFSPVDKPVDITPNIFTLLEPENQGFQQQKEEDQEGERTTTEDTNDDMPRLGKIDKELQDIEKKCDELFNEEQQEQDYDMPRLDGDFKKLQDLEKQFEKTQFKNENVCIIANLNEKAQGLLLQKRFSESLLYFDKALSINYDNKAPALVRDPHIYSFNGKGSALIGLGKYQEAIPYLDKVISYIGNDIIHFFHDTFNNKGLALYKLGKFEEAIPYFDKALINSKDYKSLITQDYKALNNKGATLSALGRYEEAIDNYDMILYNDPSNVDALNNKGNALSALGRFQEATEQYDKALEEISHQQMPQNIFRMSDLLDYKLDSDSPQEVFPIPPVAYKLAPEGLQEFDRLVKYSDLSYMQNLDLPIFKEDNNIRSNSIGDLNKINNLLLSVKNTVFVNLHRYNEFNGVQFIGLSEKLDDDVIMMIQLYINQGITVFEGEKFEEANNSFDKALNQNPNYTSTLYYEDNNLKLYYASIFYYKDLTLKELGNEDEAKEFQVKFENLKINYHGEKFDNTILGLPEAPLGDLLGM